MTRHTATSRTLATVTALALITGCTSGPTDKDAPLPTRTLAEVTQQIDTDVTAVATAAGTEPTRRTDTPTPCTGRNGEFADDDRWQLSTSLNIAVPADDQLTTIGRIRTALQQQGWEITKENTYADGTRGLLSAHNPATGHSTSLYTAQDLTSIAVTLSSPCAMPAPGENPLKN